ncbi:MAG: hypothetical protein H7Y01_01995, partial [Ferruginibacter sp.]|nr:hypothetical protein [Chitinophagaceae bacterium]
MKKFILLVAVSCVALLRLQAQINRADNNATNATMSTQNNVNVVATTNPPVQVMATQLAQFVARHAMTSAQYQTEFNNWTSKGYRVTSLCGYTRGGQELYAAIWNKTAGPAWAAKHGLTGAEYQASFNEMSNNGYRLICISGYGVGNQAKFSALWDKSGGGAWAAKHNMTAAQYQQAFDDYGKQGYRLQYVSGYVVGGTEYFAAIWEKKSGGAMAVKHNMTAAQYQQAFNEFTGQGYTLKLVSGY